MEEEEKKEEKKVEVEEMPWAASITSDACSFSGKEPEKEKEQAK